MQIKTYFCNLLEKNFANLKLEGRLKLIINPVSYLEEMGSRVT